MLRSLWAYRGFIWGSVKRELQLKYRNSLLGALWVVIHPLSMIIVYTVIFSQIMRARLPGAGNESFSYSIYLCAGLLTWGLFAEIITRGQNIFIENANLLKKLNFPRLCLPVIVVISSLLNFSIIFGLFIIFLVVSGNFPGISFLAFFPLLGILVSFAIGLAVTLGVLNVFFRDVGQFFSVALTFWFWGTPIVYPASILPDGVKQIMVFNPMFGLIDGFQAVFANSQWPCINNLWSSIVLAVVFLGSGFYLFRKHAGEIVDEL